MGNDVVSHCTAYFARVDFRLRGGRLGHRPIPQLLQPGLHDSVELLSEFSTLNSTVEGQALLQANLQTEIGIYLNSTPAEKLTAAVNAQLDSVNTPYNLLEYGRSGAGASLSMRGLSLARPELPPA